MEIITLKNYVALFYYYVALQWCRQICEYMNAKESKAWIQLK